MEELVSQYVEQLRKLEARKAYLIKNRKNLPKAEYFTCFQRIATLNDEIREIEMTLEDMIKGVKYYSEGGPR